MMTVGNKGITLIVGVLFATTAVMAYRIPVSGNDKVTIMLVGTFVTLLVSELLKSKLYHPRPPDEFEEEKREKVSEMDRHQ